MRSFFFYDLETSGFSPRYDRIMQFAGQRTDERFQPIGEPVNLLIKMTDDTLPSPGAILTTGITPQQTISEGISESDFCRYFLDKIATPDTIMLGYNSVRFDDEFMRHTLWRNFQDPYEWSWSNGRSRWDILDVARCIRALRPEGINWPIKKKEVNGNIAETPTVNLVDMAKSNGFENVNAHDAMYDVIALINLTKLLRDKQPKIFDYLLKHRDKESVLSVIKPESPQPFIYTSGRYDSCNEKTTVGIVIGSGKSPGSYLIWDLRFSSNELSKLSKDDLLNNFQASFEDRKKNNFPDIPVKEIKPARCPAVAPLGVMDNSVSERINLTIQEVKDNLDSLRSNKGFIDSLITAYHSKPDFPQAMDVEGKLYDSFTPREDKTKIRLIAAADANSLADLHLEFTDERLSELLFRYKARQYPKSLSEDEQLQWENYRSSKILRELPKYLEELSKFLHSGSDSYIIGELELWAESITPMDY